MSISSTPSPAWKLFSVPTNSGCWIFFVYNQYPLKCIKEYFIMFNRYLIKNHLLRKFLRLKFLLGWKLVKTAKHKSKILSSIVKLQWTLAGNFNVMLPPTLSMLGILMLCCPKLQSLLGITMCLPAWAPPPSLVRDVIVFDCIQFAWIAPYTSANTMLLLCLYNVTAMFLRL